MTSKEKCPICGTVNKDLNLDETNGWFICDKCGSEVNNLTHCKTIKIPILKTNDDIKKHFGIT